MIVRVLMIGSVFFLAALPQGAIICQGENGHLRLEVRGMPCCSSRASDCGDCTDRDLLDACQVSGDYADIQLDSTRQIAESLAPSVPRLDARLPFDVETIEPPPGVDLRMTVVLLI